MTTSSSEVNVAALLAQAPDALIYASRDGVIRAWNAAAERIFGHAEADAIGQRLDLIVPDRFREAHWTGWERAHGNGVTQYVGQSLPTRATHANGDTITVELSFAIVLDEAGDAIGAIATARDITERFEQDRANRRRMNELEEELEKLRSN